MHACAMCVSVQAIFITEIHSTLLRDLALLLALLTFEVIPTRFFYCVLKKCQNVTQMRDTFDRRAF